MAPGALVESSWGRAAKLHSPVQTRRPGELAAYSGFHGANPVLVLNYWNFLLKIGNTFEIFQD